MTSLEGKAEKKGPGFEELQKKVILRGVCTSCGACFITCPFPEVLEYALEGPILAGECTICGICLRVCPQYKLEIREIEKMVFGRERKPEEVFGIYKMVYVARSTVKEIRGKCQDGGIATTLLTSALASGTIDGAAISGRDSSNPWLPKPTLATNRIDIIENAGTRYSYSPNLIAYKEGISRGLEKTAFVGTPCQILALRGIQRVPLRKYSKALSFTIGLFCSESFSYKGLIIEKIQDKLGIDLREITKMNIKGGVIVDTKSGKTVKIPLKEVKAYAEPKCRHCNDFSAELADISVGGVGLNGWTFTIIRTDKGTEVFEQALNKGLLEVKPVEEFDSAFNLLKRLSETKRKGQGKT